MTKNTRFPTVPLHQVPRPQAEDTYRPTVIVVDDESNIANTLAEILSRSGYDAIATYDAESALETALIRPPEILITDIMLPGANGIDLAIRMRRIFPDCKILLFSGQAASTDLLATARNDGHHFPLLSKPVHPLDLLARISELAASRKHAASATT